ncbi:Family with sequence similarity 21 [Porites harrisoni]
MESTSTAKGVAVRQVTVVWTHGSLFLLKMICLVSQALKKMDCLEVRALHSDRREGFSVEEENLFDDVDGEKEDLFAEQKTEETDEVEKPKEEDGESSLVKPRARSTASGKRIPAGAVSIFGDSGLFGSPTKEDLSSSLTKSHSKEVSETTKPKPKSEVKGGGLFDGDDEDDLFTSTTSKPSTAPTTQEATTVKKSSSKKVDLFGDDGEEEDEGDLFADKPPAKETPAQAPPKKKLPVGAVSLFGSSPPPLLISKKTEDEEEDDTGLLSKSKVTPPPKKATVEAKPPPATQPSKPKSGGGLFSDEDEEEGGGLFGAPAVKPQLPKVETKSKPKSKTTISLFDDDEQDDEDEDFFSAPASTKANSGPVKKASSTEKPKEEVKESKPSRDKPLGLFDDDEDDLFNSPSPKPVPSPNATPTEVRKKEKPKSSSKIQSLFDADEADEGTFGEAADDIFTASPPKSPQKSFESVSPLSAALSQAAPDSTDRSMISKTKPKQTTAAPTKTGLFSDEEDDLFGGKSVEEKPKVEEKKEVISESPKPKKPVGGVSMFGGVDLFAGKKPSFIGDEAEPKPTVAPKIPEAKPAVTKKGADLFNDDQEEDELFSSKPKTTKPMAPKPMAPAAKAKPSSDLFGDSTEDDLFSAPAKPPSIESKPVKPVVTAKPDVEVKPSKPSKPVEPVKPKKPAGAVSMFGGVDLFGASKSPPSSAAAAKAHVTAKPKDPLADEDDDENDLFASKPKVKVVQEPKPEPTLPLPVPKAGSSSGSPVVSPKTSPVKPSLGIEKLQKSLAFNPAMLRPGATPPKKVPEVTVASFDSPATVTTLESANKDRAKIQVKRRPPTRQARRAAAATVSASDDTLFGSTPSDVAGASARLSWPGGLSPPGGLGKSEVLSGPRPPRTDTRDSDMSDEFFGFSGSSSSKINKEDTWKPPPIEDPLAGGLFLASDSKLKTSKVDDLFADDSDSFSVSSDKTNKKPTVVENSTSSANDDDLFSIGNAKNKANIKTREPLGGDDIFSPKAPSGEDIFAPINNKKTFQPKSEIKPSKPVQPKTTSPLDDDDDLFEAGKKDDKSVVNAAETKPAEKETLPIPDAGLFPSSSVKPEIKPDKKETEKPTADKKFSSPLGEDEDLFSVSAPVKKDIKPSGVEKKETDKPSADKKFSSPLGEDDDLFSVSAPVKKDIKPPGVEKKETDKPNADKKFSSPLGEDDDLFIVSAPVKKDVKPSGAESVTKKTSSPATSKKTTPKPSSILDEDDDNLFSVKKVEPRKPKKVNKPLGDDELFGDSGDIFSDIPSKPKDKKKKKSATTAPAKDDIFADQSAAGDEKSIKKTTTKAKKKPEKKPSIFDDDVPSIFDDPLNATSK